MSFLVICFFLRANGFIEEAVNQLEVEYTDSEEEVLQIQIWLFSWHFSSQLFPVQAAGSKEKVDISLLFFSLSYVKDYQGRQRRETQEVIETIVEQKSVQDTHK